MKSYGRGELPNPYRRKEEKINSVLRGEIKFLWDFWVKMFEKQLGIRVLGCERERARLGIKI